MKSWDKPVERLAGRHELRRTRTSWHLATGTLACPSCDAPVLPGPGGMSPADLLSCGFCRHEGAVRDFLSLAEPIRPTRVTVRVRVPPSRIREPSLDGTYYTE